MLFNVVVSLLLLFVIVKLHLVKSLLKLLLSICCIPFILISKCVDFAQKELTKPKKKVRKVRTKSETEKFHEELQQLLEKYNKTSI